MFTHIKINFDFTKIEISSLMFDEQSQFSQNHWLNKSDFLVDFFTTLLFVSCVAMSVRLLLGISREKSLFSL